MRTVTVLATLCFATLCFFTSNAKAEFIDNGGYFTDSVTGTNFIDTLGVSHTTMIERVNMGFYDNIGSGNWRVGSYDEARDFVTGLIESAPTTSGSPNFDSSPFYNGALSELLIQFGKLDGGSWPYYNLLLATSDYDFNPGYATETFKSIYLHRTRGGALIVRDQPFTSEEAAARASYTLSFLTDSTLNNTAIDGVINNTSNVSAPLSIGITLSLLGLFGLRRKRT